MSDKTKTEVQVETISADEMENLLGTPGADAVITPEEPAEGEKVKTFFQKEKVDMKFLDPNSPADPPEPTDPPADPPADPPTDGDPLADPPADPPADPANTESFDTIIAEELDEDGNPKPGRPALDKVGMAQLAQTLIDDKMILPFEDEEKKLEDYTMTDYKEIFKMNFDSHRQQIQADTPREFFESLPPELQSAAKYVLDGGDDLKGMFRALAASEESKAMTIDTEAGQERAARQFLQATNFGNEEEIQEQIDSWKDLDKLEAKAQQFKPKLDAMQDQIVQRQLQEQESKRAQREKQSQMYADSIYNTLAEGKIGDLKMNNKVQNMLYQGLIQPNYQSVQGQPTNLFGHLIEKHQYIEPNHGLIAEALWLLADPDGYRSEIAKGASNEAVADTARKLKIEQSNKVASGSGEPDAGGGKKPASPGLKREPKNFFKR
jgi:hypothetical protein